MYYCEECEGEFESPKIFVEKHGLSEPPFERFTVCPRCGSDRLSAE